MTVESVTNVAVAAPVVPLSANVVTFPFNPDSGLIAVIDLTPTVATLLAVNHASTPIFKNIDYNHILYSKGETR